MGVAFPLSTTPLLSPVPPGPPSPPPTTRASSAAVSSPRSSAGVGRSWGAMVTSFSCLWDWCIACLLLHIARGNGLKQDGGGFPLHAGAVGGVTGAIASPDHEGQLGGGQLAAVLH